MLALLVSSYRSQNSGMRRRDSMHQMKKPKRGIRDRALYSSYRRGGWLAGVVME